jgi:hypothetical protein
MRSRFWLILLAVFAVRAVAAVSAPAHEILMTY